MIKQLKARWSSERRRESLERLTTYESTDDWLIEQFEPIQDSKCTDGTWDFRGLRLNNLSLQSFNFGSCYLDFSGITDCNLLASSLSGSKARYCKFERTEFHRNRNIKSSPCFINLDGTFSMFEACVLEKAAFLCADLQCSVFKNCNLRNASFSSANCRGASFLNSDLTDARFPGANLEGVDFTGAILNDTDFSGAIMNGVALD